MDFELEELSRAIFTPTWPTRGQNAKLNTVLIEVIGDVYRLATSQGISTISLKAHSKEVRTELVRGLLRIDYVLPAKGSVLGQGHAAWTRVSATRTMMASHVQWDDPSMETIHVHLSPIITRLLPMLRSEFEKEDVYNRLRLPGAFTPGLYSFLISHENWPVEVSLSDLKKIWWPEGGRKMPTSYNNTSNLWNIVLSTALGMIHRYSDLRIQAEKIMGTLNGHHVIVGARFYLQGIKPPQTRYPAVSETSEGEHPARPKSRGGKGRAKGKAKAKALAAA